VSAIVQSISKKDKLFTKCLDMYGFLTLAQDPYVTFESGMRVHADAIKANFESVVESRIKLSFEIPYPEIIIKCTETATTAARGAGQSGRLCLPRLKSSRTTSEMEPIAV
jgi:hypothetical protein